ncbi:glycosyltransferase family 2 protein [Pontibaca salina]|uniref:Glycosyltransferase n=1 Tax=Pontibaca salina TaxID=2795731 RepID=A0A934HW73_9RHOB|nr:hypothetical protein [Pontibaca salina]MBI6630654.1 hypothetical protein [Pontibaca salina]
MITLQNLALPETAICTEHDLYYRAFGAAGYSQSRGEIRLERQTRLTLDTYFNLLNIGKWHHNCDLDGLYAEIAGGGLVEIRIVQAFSARSWEVLYCEIVTLDPARPYCADLSHYAATAPVLGLIYIAITALGEDGATVSGGRFATRTRLAKWPELAVSITTFKREQAVRATVARLERFLAGSDHGAQIRVQVVDNGASAGIPNSARVRAIANPNYGGAGGFARGLLEAERSGCSHCLFIDDDASFHMENIARTYVFLALSKERRTAVAGAMISNTHKWAMWENGALFDGLCRPLHGGTDLRDRKAVFAMEHASLRAQPPTFYGGWWFFAFAIDQVRHHPFPFFVRGDDISFSLMNDFNICTLNGVVSFQDDFFEKESAQTQYLDLRSHLIHHLVSQDLDRPALATAKTALRLILRSLLRFHYETAAVQLLAWQDMMQGPDFFDQHIDMAGRRAAIGKMIRTERLQAVAPGALAQRQKYTLRARARRQRLGLWTLNGHLLPFSARRWDRIVLDSGARGSVFPALGAARITYLNAAGDKGYTVTQSKRAFFALCWQIARTLGRFLRQHDTLKAAYREGYGPRTSRTYWETALLQRPPPPPLQIRDQQEKRPA